MDEAFIGNSVEEVVKIKLDRKRERDREWHRRQRQNAGIKAKPKGKTGAELLEYQKMKREEYKEMKKKSKVVKVKKTENIKEYQKRYRECNKKDSNKPIKNFCYRCKCIPMKKSDDDCSNAFVRCVNVGEVRGVLVYRHHAVKHCPKITRHWYKNPNQINALDGVNSDDESVIIEL